MTIVKTDEYSLETLLNSLKMDALKNIRRNLDLKNMSSLRKKELVQALKEHIPASVPERANMMDLDQYSSIVALMTKSGIMELHTLNLEDVFYLSSIGYIHPTKQEEIPVAVMPQEIMDQFYKLNPADLKQVVKRNQKITNIIFGMIRYYGLIDLKNARQLIEAYLQEEIEENWFSNYVTYLEDYYGAFHLIGEYIVNELVKDKDELIQEQASREGLNYCPIPADVMMNTNRREAFDRTPEINELVTYLQNSYSLSKEEADDLVGQMITRVQTGTSLGEIVAWFGEHIALKTEKDVNSLAKKIIMVINYTRLWVLKGYTPVELSPQKPASKPVQATSVKVGRNEPCPCGSGKKYKKCCGK